MNPFLTPIKFRPILKEKVWGGERLESLLGKPLEGRGSVGESWEISDHGDDCSVVAHGPMAGRSLRELLSESPDELLGQPERGLDWAARALAIDAEDLGVLYNVACLYSLEGEAEKALDCLEQAVQQGFGNLEWFEHDPDLDPIREHPRFQALMTA